MARRGVLHQRSWWALGGRVVVASPVIPGFIAETQAPERVHQWIPTVQWHPCGCWQRWIGTVQEIQIRCVGFSESHLGAPAVVASRMIFNQATPIGERFVLAILSLLTEAEPEQPTGVEAAAAFSQAAAPADDLLRPSSPQQSVAGPIAIASWMADLATAGSHDRRPRLQPAEREQLPPLLMAPSARPFIQHGGIRSQRVAQQLCRFQTFRCIRVLFDQGQQPLLALLFQGTSAEQQRSADGERCLWLGDRFVQAAQRLDAVPDFGEPLSEPLPLLIAGTGGAVIRAGIPQPTGGSWPAGPPAGQMHGALMARLSFPGSLASAAARAAG